MFPRHTYGDWVRSETNVGIILADESKGPSWSKKITVQWYNGPMTISGPVFDLITEHEYHYFIDPKRCGPTIDEIIQSTYQSCQEDFFSGGYVRNSIYRPLQGEDLFGKGDAS